MTGTPLLTFSQTHGYESLPELLRLEELPQKARIHIINTLTQLVESHWRWNNNTHHRELVAPLLTISRDVYMDHYGRQLARWTPELALFHSLVEATVMHDKFHKVFDLVQYILRHPYCPGTLIVGMKTAFANGRIAYSIDDSGPPTIIPMVTPQEGNAISSSLKQLADAGLGGSASHLRKSSECINRREWADSIRESIHAVESVAMKIDPEVKTKGLKVALQSLKEQVDHHTALQQAILKLYGYASDEKGIRHALQDKSNPRVGMDEAVFMLGTCASIASYLWRKHSAT